MPVLKLYPNGLTGGFLLVFSIMLLSFVAIVRVGRFVLVGAHPGFLYSVLTPELPVSAIGVPLLGLSGSLTLRDCPPSPPSHDDWKNSEKLCFSV